MMMKNKKQSTGRNVLTALLITALAFLLSLLFAQPLTFSAGALMQTSDKQDFNMTDFYNIVADSRPVKSLDRDVVIVDIANTDRDDVIDVLDVLSFMNPRAIGLDVTFNEPRPGDERLLDAISRLPNLVMAVGVSQQPGSKDSFLVDDYSYFYPDSCETHSHGVVNLPTRTGGSTVRNFIVEFHSASGENIPSLAYAVAAMADPDAARALKLRGNSAEAIDYPSRIFTIIPWQELPDRAADVDGKVVLVGAIGELGDSHATPVNDRMSGVMIHAHALSTILRANYFTVVPRAVNMLIAFIICFLLCFTNTAYRSPARGMWLRIGQIAVLYAIIRIGYWLYIDRHVIVDFSYSMLMLAFGFFAFDIWLGVTHYISKAYNHFRKTHQHL